jgi:ubiquinone/menaquinone biosynthesis C-methylase UbiE
MLDLNGVRCLYAQTASRYERQVVPVMRPLANDLTTWVIRCMAAQQRGALYDPFDLEPEDGAKLLPLTALDIGTGTGILARTLAPHVKQVIGLDLSLSMLRQADGAALWVNADLHHLCLRPGAIDLVVASFGLNASSPKPAFRSVARALRAGGLLIFQEWGAESECSRLVDETFEQYAPDEIPGLDETLLAYYAARKPWYDRLQDVEDYYEMLKQVGFELVWAKEQSFATAHLSSIEVFLDYQFAFPLRRLALAVLSTEARAAFESDVRAQLQPYLNPDGSLDWAPPLFRVCAVR